MKLPQDMERKEKGHMAGYYNYSMSINAIAAYEDGLKPISKWAKKDFIEFAANLKDTQKVELIKKAKISELKKLLTCTEWHHTSSRFNKTNFYRIDEDWIEECTIDQLKALLNSTKKKPETEYKAVCTFLEWSGTRKHPKATELTEEGVIKGNWFYRSNGSKKSIKANGFQIIEKI